jgi:hypothetical protein
MDVESLSTLKAATDYLQAASNTLLSSAVQSLQATVDKANVDLAATIAGLDGWTLEITIPPISIKLSRPK